MIGQCGGESLLPGKERGIFGVRTLPFGGSQTIDRAIGTTPWGLIIFLLLGFCAGILSVLRSAGMVAERKLTPGGRDAGDADKSDK